MKHSSSVTVAQRWFRSRSDREVLCVSFLFIMRRAINNICGASYPLFLSFFTREYYIAKKKQGKVLCGTRKLSERY